MREIYTHGWLRISLWCHFCDKSLVDCRCMLQIQTSVNDKQCMAVIRYCNIHDSEGGGVIFTRLLCMAI